MPEFQRAFFFKSFVALFIFGFSTKLTTLQVFLLIFLGIFTFELRAAQYNMVFVPASEKGDENDYEGLLMIVENITKFKINTIKVTDYNAAVEAMRAGRAHIAWY